MVETVVALARSVWRAIGPHLHDPSPPDLAISACFLAAIGVLTIVCLHPRAQFGDRMRWACVGTLLAALLLNQQGDLHNLVLHALRLTAPEFYAELGRPAVQLLEPLSFATAVAVLGGAIMAFTGRGRPPGPVAGAGLLLLLVHAAGRGATFLGFIPDLIASQRLHAALRICEVAGLALIVLAALRYRPVRSVAAPGAQPVSVG